MAWKTHFCGNNMHIAIEVLMEMVFSKWSMPMNQPCASVWRHRSHKRRQKGNPVSGSIMGHPIPCDINTETCPSRLGEFQIGDSKIWSWGLWDPNPRMTAPVRPSSDRKLQAHLLIREGSPHLQSHKYLTVITIWSWAPRGCLASRQTSRLIVGHNITSDFWQTKEWNPMSGV
jgi:hypothetical protein